MWYDGRFKQFNNLSNVQREIHKKTQKSEQNERRQRQWVGSIYQP